MSDLDACRLHELTACEQVNLLRSGELGSRELVDHYLDRIDRHGERLGAFISVFADRARAQADDADADRDRSGLLHGLPLGLKDLHPTAGLPTTFGSAALADHVPTEDGAAVGRLRASGAVIVGKTNACELGPTCYTDSLVGGVAVTPWDLERSASGSSGGAAAAVAAGLLPVGHASDGLGSIRTPAASCGLVGMKPSRGAVAGSGLEFFHLGVEGPVARTVADARLLLAAIGPGDPDTVGGLHPDHRRLGGPDRLRVGVRLDPGIGGSVDPVCAEAVRAAATALSDLGHHVEEAGSGPRIDVLIDSILTQLRTSLRLTVATLMGGRTDQLMPYTRWLVEAPAHTAEELLLAHRSIAAASLAHSRSWAGYDVLLTPTTTAPPTRRDELRADDAAESAARMLRWSAFTPWANFAGHPAVSLPVHETADGLPIGVQLTARRAQDDLLLDVAAELETVFAWHHRHPDLWSDERTPA